MNATTAPNARLARLFPGFTQHIVDVGDTFIHALKGGEGPPLLLLHGHPQTLACWHKVAPALARHFTVVLTDLRGYGDSGKPPTDAEHTPYSKRAMAADQVKVMSRFGFSTFHCAAHDRGARVLHRLLLDHPDRVSKAALLDIAPTATMYDSADAQFAKQYVWWFFLIQPAPLPERLIGNNLDFYLEHHIEKQNKTPGAIVADAFEEYRRCYTRETLHAVCEDYRAAAGIDLEHDRQDIDKRIASPVLVLWGEQGVVGRTYDVLQTWRDRSGHGQVSGRPLPCGHYLPEEAPQETALELERFFSSP